MQPVYVQQLLKVLIEEYEDIDYMLETFAEEQPSKRDREQIRNLLSKLNDRNERLLSRFPG